MARMIPELNDAELSTIKSFAEADVYKRFRDQTPNEWVVIYHTPYVCMSHGERTDGEADFIVLVPGLGILVLEVKGGTFGHDNRGWYAINNRGQRFAKKNPFEQVMEEKRAILKLLNKRPAFKSAHPDRLLCGHAVFLRDVRNLKAAVHPSSPLGILGGLDQFERLHQWILRVFDYWKVEESASGAKWSPLTKAGMDAAELVLATPILVKPLLKRRLAAEEEIRIELTSEQQLIFRILQYKERVAIFGGAGTGKSLLALARARELAQEGKRTLLLCFNRLLADYFKTACEGEANLTRQCRRAGEFVAWWPRF